MRILYVCGDLGIPAFGRKGASTHLREMIAAFRELGHDVALAASDLSGDRRPEEDFPAYKLPMPTSKTIGLDGRYLWANYRAQRVLRQAVTDFRPDAIYERLALYFSAGNSLARSARLPRILEVNSLLSHEQKERLHFPALARRMEVDVLRRAPAIAAISNHMIETLEKLGCTRTGMRPFSMAVDPKRIHPPADPGIHRREMGWPDDAIVLGYVGSMNSYHQPNWFMDLAEKMLRREENRRVRFLIVGGSPSKIQRHRARLAKWVAEHRVVFAGTVPQADMPEWLSAMDAVLIPGASPQSTPTKIFEAAALARPLVMPATEPIRELCGADSPMLFRANDFTAFEGKVREFVKAPGGFEPAANQLRDKVLREHTWNGHAAKLVEWFEELKSTK